LKYLLDSNTYIQAKNQYYGMDICPAYWDWLDQQAQQGVVASIALIGKELKEGNDELAIWVRERDTHFIRNDDVDTQTAFAEIAQWAAEGDYNPGNRDNFLAKADPWIIAKAKVLGATVVTHESLAAMNTRKIKVPNVCEKFGVSCQNTFQFLSELNARFVLER
jgi:NAD(P)H-dependent flavin oxidoreductase YrpB (nitropropane dioxygenase family)